MVSPLPRSTGRDPEGFETFYKDVRGRLLLQTYALTGDLHAAQRAVRDALVVTWHHWRKVARLDRPEDYVRPLAWTRAQRRSSARWRARREELPDDVRATLEAVGKLTSTQRRVLLLAHLTPLPLDAIAREVGITRNAAERELQTASAQFSVHRGVASTAIRPALERLEPVIAGVRWPRSSIIMRAGSARRRVHTGVGVAAAVALVAVAGSVVTQDGGAHPALAAKGITEGISASARPQSSPVAAPAEPDPLTDTALLTADQVAAGLPAQWTEVETTKNTDGDGLTFTCQGARYADVQGVGELVRTFTGTATKAAPGVTTGALTAGQSAEASASTAAAEKAYETTLDWYAGCTSPRVQLLSTHRVQGVGDEATMFVLRDWAAPVTTQVVGVARTGTLTTTVVDTLTGMTDPAREPDLDPSAQLLATAVTGLCTLPGAGTCTATPTLQDASPIPVGNNPALLVEADLPPVPGVDQPWVGSTTRKAKVNVAATRCDKTEFTGPGFTDAKTRSYVIPDATGLPAEFGLTETVGALPRKQAQAFVAKIRSELDACPDKDLATTVEQLQQQSSGPRDLEVWRLTVSVSEKRTVRYLMAVIREGNAVAQLTFVPSDTVSIGPKAFLTLAGRAQERLGQLASG